MDGNNEKWVPTDEKLETEYDQVISWNIPVSYVCSERIRCIIPKNISEEIDKLIQSIQYQQYKIHTEILIQHFFYFLKLNSILESFLEFCILEYTVE